VTGQPELRDRLLEQLTGITRHIASLQAAHAGILAASEASNADDEHDACAQ
jgi:hypothetical protein